MTAIGIGVFAMLGAGPAGAFPITAPLASQHTDIVTVGYHGGHGHHDHWHGHHHDHWHGHGGHRWHGYDGYYDDDDGSGMLFKALVTGTLLGRQRTEAYDGGHSRDCAARYRSYRSSDNTYQPSQGPRRACR
jgi:hypothetical protein